MRTLCMYLPQYHTFPENDKWWGKGYTEWSAVKSAEPLFKNHLQPKVPLNKRYYDLVEDGVNTWKWQAELAKEYGVYGFCVYQYWFCGKMLMQKPLEILLEHPEIEINYSICWANETWTRTWYGLESEILMKQEYGIEKDWKNHFDYLLQFFKDERYIKIDNKPILHIYRSFDIECLPEMKKCFDIWAKAAGFDGVCIIVGKTAGESESRDEIVDAYYTFEPGFSLKHGLSRFQIMQYNISVALKSAINRLFNKKILERVINIDWIYNAIISRDYSENECPGIIGEWDNTPRRKHKGLIYKGSSADKFEKVLRVLKKKVEGRKYDFVYINAWNEWGEGAMLEPEETLKYSYLEVIKKVSNS